MGGTVIVDERSGMETEPVVTPRTPATPPLSLLLLPPLERDPLTVPSVQLENEVHV